MSTSKKRDAENNTLLELRFTLAYYLHWNTKILLSEKKTLRNYWLNKREIKEQVKEHNAKIDDIAKFVTKYISDRKSQK